MAAAYFGEGSYGAASATVIHADASPPDHIIVADAQLLFTAHFHRAGPDLVLTGRDGHNHIIPGYFASEHHAALVAPNGALLSADLVDLLAGSAAPNEYAQAGQITPPEPIGRVEKVVGTVTIVRNGVAVALNVGDAVYKSDVVQTAANSSCGVAFPDGSALNLVANTRMALSDYVYDPNSTSNSALFNLVEGGLSFVAGKVAHTGDMKIGTPIATMGIRGTAGWLYEEQVANITANAGNVTLHFAAVFDSVTNTESIYTLYAIDANGQPQHDANGNLISLALVSSTQNGLVTTLTGNGINGMPSVTTGPPDFSQQQFANIVVPQVINVAVQAIQQYQNQQQQQQNPTNPQSNPGGTGSGTPPPTPNGNENQPLQQILNLNGGGPPVTITATVSPTPGSSTPPPSPPQSVLTPSTGPTTVIWSPQSGNLWNNSGNWNGGSPGVTVNAEVNSPTAAIVNDPGNVINNLTVGAPGTVEAVGNASDPSTPGSLTVAGTTDDSGTIKADSTISDPVITFGNAVTVETGGVIEAVGAGNTASIIFASSVTLDAAAGVSPGGLIEATGNGASVTFNAGVTVEAGAQIEATGAGASITFLGGPQVINSGLIEADNGGAVTFFDVQVENASGVIEATGSFSINSGSMVSLMSLSGVDIVGGTLETGNPAAASDGEIEVGAGLEATFFDGSTGAGAVTVDAYVEVAGGASLDLVGAINGDGTITVTSGATLTLSDTIVDGPSVDNFGTASADAGTTSTLEGGSFTNEAGATVEATGAGSEIIVRNGADNFGIIEASSGGFVSLDGDLINELGATVQALAGGTVDITPAGGGNYGTISADGANAAIVLDISNAHGGGPGNVGTLQALDDGTVTVTGGANETFNNNSGGMLQAESGGMVSVEVATDDAGGQIVASGAGSFIDFSLGVTGGAATISDGAKLEYGWSSDVTTAFNGAGTLVLDNQNESGPNFVLQSSYMIGSTTFDTASYSGTIDGFGVGDTLDLTGFGTQSTDHFQALTSYDAATNTTTLTVVDTSRNETAAPLTFSGNYSNSAGWAVASDGHGGVDVTATPAMNFDPTYLTFTGNGQSAIGPVPSTQTSNVTIAGWFDWTGGNAIGSQEVLFDNGTTNSQGYGVIVAPTANGLDVQGLVGGNTVLDGNTALSANQWYFVALTEVAGTFNLYVDGVEIALQPSTSGVNAIGLGAQMQIGGSGAFNDPEIFSGSIADVSVWNTALTQSQIQEIQGTYLSGNESGLAGYYPLSDGSGTTAADSVNSAGNLALRGNPTWVVNGSNSWRVTGGDVPENTSATLVGLNASNVNPDDTITVTLDVSHGALTLGSTAGLSSETGLGTGAVTLTGTEAEIDAALASGLTYTPTAGFVGGDTLTVIADDGGVASSPDSLAINVVEVADFWGQEQFPAVVQGEHLFTASPQYNATFGVVALAYNETSDYSTSETSYTVTRNAASLDPFFLPDSAGSQVLHTDTVNAPSRNYLILPNISFSGTVSAEGIYTYKGQVNSDGTGGNALWQVIVTPDANGDGGVTAGTPIEIGNSTTTGETIYSLTESFKNGTTTPATATSFDVAWDQYNSSTNSYNLEVQITPINGNGTFGTPTTFSPAITESGSTSVTVADTALPAWEFRAAGSGSGSPTAYALAIAENDTTTNTGLNLTGPHQAVHIQDYTATGGTTGTGVAHFTIQPNLTAYASGATNEIVQPVISGLSPYPGQVAQALQFVQVSSSNSGDYAVAWNETVTNAAGTVVLGDQVEFAVYQPTTSTLVSQSEFQIADGQAQNIRMGEFADPFTSGQDDVVLAYGDDTGTHILEYAVTNSGASVSLIADFTDPTTQTFDNVAVLGDGRIAITYDDLVNPSPDETSQYDFRIFDLRTQGLDNPTLSTTENNYIAGTHYSDTVTGANSVDNEYYFVGQDSANGTAPNDTFHGGGSGGWNIAIFADARSDYSISTQIESNGPNITTIASNGDDPAHVGSLAVTNVEFLAFDPASDPTPQNNIIDVNGGTFVILGGSSAITIEAGATAEIDSAASGQSSYAGNVSFAGSSGVLQVDQLNELTGQISGITHGDPNQVLDLDGFNAPSSDQFSVSAILNGSGDTVLTVTDITGGSQPSESVTLVGDYTNATWTATNDGHGGVNVADPPSVDLNSAGSSGFLPGDEQISFGPNGEVTYTIDSGMTVSAATQNQTTIVGNGGVVVGGPGNDNFVFQPGMGAETVANFNPQQDTLTFDHFTAAQTTQELQSLITTDGHGDALVNLGHGDSITLTGVTTAQLQQAIQAGHVLLH